MDQNTVKQHLALEIAHDQPPGTLLPHPSITHSYRIAIIDSSSVCIFSSTQHSVSETHAHGCEWLRFIRFTAECVLFYLDGFQWGAISNSAAVSLLECLCDWNSLSVT